MRPGCRALLAGVVLMFTAAGVLRAQGITSAALEGTIVRADGQPIDAALVPLAGCMAALSRFISRLGNRSLLFVKVLRKHNNFEWTQEAQDASTT